MHGVVQDFKEPNDVLHAMRSSYTASDALQAAELPLLPVKEASPYATCPWRVKMLVCLERNVTSIFESGEHITTAKPPRSPSLTPAQKAFARQMAQAGMRPARIRVATMQQFSLHIFRRNFTAK